MPWAAQVERPAKGFLVPSSCLFLVFFFLGGGEQGGFLCLYGKLQAWGCRAGMLCGTCWLRVPGELQGGHQKPFSPWVWQEQSILKLGGGTGCPPWGQQWEQGRSHQALPLHLQEKRPAG